MSPPTINIPGYELVRELGVGGMATVYLAIQRSLDRKVAIKVMRRNIDDVDKFERRFLMEGRTMAKLPHRNIVAVYDIVKGEEVTYIAMEFLDGGTLSQKMKEGLSLAEAISVVVQIAQALQFAHDHGIVHRDLKPANIMFRDAQTPVLTDFGIARTQDASATRLTQTGMLVGTPTYMSPEQINALDVDGRSDLYSLGILFYELLTGAPPFHGDTPIAVLMAHLTTPPPPLPAGFADFQPVVDAMLAKNRDDRFPNLREFAKSLKGAVVNNQNLWARLQSDPNQSSSEQLRALGFSVSGPASGEHMVSPVSGQVRLPPSGRGTARTPTPAPGGVERRGTGVAEAASPPSNRKWVVGGLGLIGAALLGVGIWMMLHKGPGTSGELDPKIKIVVMSTLRDVDRLIGEGKLASPPGDNAYEYLRGALEISPNYPETLKRVESLGAAFKKQGADALAKQDFDTAEARLEQARLVNPKDPELEQMKGRIADARKGATQAKAIDEQLARADAAEKEGKIFGADGAYTFLMRAAQLSPSDAKIKARVAEAVTKALAPARSALASNDVSSALADVRKLEPYLANDPEWKKLKADVDVAIDADAARRRTAAMLAKLDDEIKGGRLLEPAGDSAYETLRTALAANANDPEVLKRQDALANALLTRAQAAQRAKNNEAALSAANFALEVRPGLAAAQAIKDSVEKTLDAAKIRIADTLAKAQRALAAQQFLEPAGASAKTLLEETLKLDPANKTAKELLGDLPKSIVDAAKAHIAAGEFEEASKLAESGRKAYPSDAALASLATQASQQLAANKAKAERDRRFERLSQLLATRPPTSESVGAASREIGALLAADPRDVDAATAKKRLFESLEETLRSSTATNEIDALASAFKPAQQTFATDKETIALVGAIDQARSKIAAEEAARLAAISGELVLNAAPWANVESITDRDGKAVKLPSDASTPLKITLPAGVYNVTFRHPQAGTKREVAQVQAKSSVSVGTTFSAISSKDYLKRAGW